jgi:hypothetical protein
MPAPDDVNLSLNRLYLTCPHIFGLAAQIQLQASLRDADYIYGQPGDKSPGYYRAVPPGGSEKAGSKCPGGEDENEQEDDCGEGGLRHRPRDAM